VRNPRARHSNPTRLPSRFARSARNRADQPGSVPEWGGPSRSSSGRAIRLIATAGTAAVGMCLVLAMVAWVAAMGAPGAGTPGTTSSGVAGHASPKDRPLIGRTLATYRGTGAPNRGYFQVSRSGEWGIAWDFRCPAGQRGTFVLADGDGDANPRQRVDTAGPSGQGIYWNTSDPDDHSLEITSSCPWTARVVLPRLPAGHQGARSDLGRSIAEGHRHKTARHGPKKAKHPEESQAPEEDRPR
jgi:hypothetical protein